MRPFFLSPDGTKPSPLKPYYDIVSWAVTQLMLTFTAIPFVVLSFTDTIKLWGRVYYYGIICVAAWLIIFASPAKSLLTAQLKKRNRPTEKRKPDNTDASAPVLGLPSDPEKEVENALKEIGDEIEEIRKKDLSAPVPTVQDMRVLAEQKLRRRA